MKLRGWTIPAAALFAFTTAGVAVGACGTDYVADGNGSFGGSGGYASCSDFTSCATCTPVTGCGWCIDSNGTGQCASDPDSCPALMFSWTWDPDGCRVAADGGGVQVASGDAGAAGTTGPADAVAPTDAIPLADAVAAPGDATADAGTATSLDASASSDAASE